MPLFDRNNRSHLFDPGGDQQIAVNDEQGQALARGSQVGGAGLSNRMKSALSRGARNRGHGTTMSVDNANAVNLPMNTAFLDTGPSDVPYGARGRDPGGWPKVIPVGVPPAVFGEARRLQVPKALRIPELPSNYIQHTALVIPANSGDILDEEVAFPIGSIRVDNYSGIWIQEASTGHWMQPFSIAWTLRCYRKSTKMRIIANAPPGFTQPALVAGQSISVTASEEMQPFQPGQPIAAAFHP